MCGRYVSPDAAAVERAWTTVRAPNPFDTVFNAAPTMALPVLRMGAEGLTLEAMRWGFVPAWWSKPEAPKNTINARAEEAATKPMWREAARGGRCLVPALGWYEWQALPDGRTRQPWYFHRADGRPFCFAALCARAPRGQGGAPGTFAVLTHAATGPARAIHDRMPLVLEQGHWQAWLGGAPGESAAALAWAMREAACDFAARRVSAYVNSPRHQGAACVQAID